MSVEDLTEVIRALATDSATGQPSTYTFTAGSAYTEGTGGVLVEVPGADFTLVVSFQPISGRTLRQMPEGTMADEHQEGYVIPDTPERVITPTDERRQTKGDTVIIGGERFDVVRSHNWRHINGCIHIVVRKAYT